eukprot:CAMPEP_0196660392 /NCGR_PEP_ID=MMETSP1086-20130531/39529_1 /TAXON_ID=77921 /ORGANISM="Cyanoptyche  gloeocystis , Strain SAG4.97" /LENGTH=107 /DNA_ID=CAMNT_0041994783 /DNA_START=399 /DNA_END=722 /DNA_ORIENTATION=-
MPQAAITASLHSIFLCAAANALTSGASNADRFVGLTAAMGVVRGARARCVGVAIGIMAAAPAGCIHHALRRPLVELAVPGKFLGLLICKHQEGQVPSLSLNGESTRN